MFSGPESEIGALGDVDGKDVVELGCGTAYFGAWLAKRGARVTGVDVTPAQLETARRMQGEFNLHFPLIEASAEDVPLPDASLISRSPSTAHRSGAIPTAGSARPRDCSGQEGGSSSSATRRSPPCAPDEGKVEERLLRLTTDLGRMEWPVRTRVSTTTSRTAR